MQAPTTPGVYLTEIDGFANAVVAVPTAIPVFIGYTEFAASGNRDLTGVPMPVSSMAEFQLYFADPNGATGGAPQPRFDYTSASTTAPPCPFDSAAPRFNLYYGMQMFFDNGGGKCYVLSIGSYATAMASGASAADHLSCLPALEQCAEPTIIVMPDAVLLDSAGWKEVSQAALTHCSMIQSRVAILDIRNGYCPPDKTASDPIQGADGASGFYSVDGLGEDVNRYGIAYYPWVNTTMVGQNSIDYLWVTPGTFDQFKADLQTEAPLLFVPEGGRPNPKLQAHLDVLASMVQPARTSATDPTGRNGVNTIHQTLSNVSPLYRQTMARLCASVNLMPPGSAMAGVFTRNDNTFGVFQSPANTTIIDAVSPAVELDDAEQGELNVPLNGLAVNVIRSFPNYGLLVWGARTMAGNSDDWRYINVRRTAIMLEQSIKYALQAFVFEPNTSVTWATVTAMLNNFLSQQWKSGALAGSQASEAFSVAVGLGQTMTSQDILDGVMNVMVKVAVVRPAEFIAMTFQQQMQTS
jgi:hypothetical protein